MKHTHKFILDAVMAIILVLLYKKLVISLAFHEIAGLILFVLFAVHLIVNRKWIRTVALSLNNRSIPVKTKVCYVVDILLLICWVFAGLSGILISKILFSMEGPLFWKLVHFSCSAYALVLTGIHIGLHWPFITGILNKKLRLPAAVKKVMAVLCIAASIIYGGWNLSATSMARWLSIPFTAAASQISAAPAEAQKNPSVSAGGKEEVPSIEKAQQTSGTQKARPPREPVTIGSIIKTMLQFLSILFFFACITAGAAAVCARKWTHMTQRRCVS